MPLIRTFQSITKLYLKQKTERGWSIVPCIIESDGISREQRRKWSNLIRKIYEVDPLVCPKCQGAMRVISEITNEKIIKAILKHLGLWLVKSRSIPKAHAPPVVPYLMDDYSQLPMNDDHLCRDPEYSWNAYIQA